MDTKLLNKYIAGDVLPEEKKEVVRWLKENEEHREQLMQLRHIYDATVWNANLKEEKPGKKKTVTHYLRTSIKIAPGLSLSRFIISGFEFEFSINSFICCSLSWLSIISCCAWGNWWMVKNNEYLSLLLKIHASSIRSNTVFPLLPVFFSAFSTLECCLLKG